MRKFAKFPVGRFAGAVLAICAFRPALADEFYQHAVMNCSATLAEVTTHGTYNDDPAPKGVNECQVPGVGSIRLKMGAGPTYPYGEGYGDATMFVSLWLNQVKVVSRESFKCEYAGRCELRIAVSRTGLRVCRRPRGNPQSPESCLFTQTSDLPTGRDTAEYPMPGQRVRPLDGSVAAVFRSEERRVGKECRWWWCADS